MNEIINQINIVGNRIFTTPSPTYSYDELIFKIKVLGSNTYRGFHRVDKSKPGAQDAFESVLRNEKDYIIKALYNAKSEKDIDNLELYICKSIKERLKANIRLGQLDSFNKIRKPVDIVIVHLVAMCDEFNSNRSALVQYLYLPLDSQIFQSSITFSDDEVKELGIQRNYTFKDVTESSHYYKIQDFLNDKAKKLAINNRISFDLIWGDRYKKNISNLFADSF